MRMQLLSTCHRLLVFADGLEDHQTWEFLAAADMLTRGVRREGRTHSCWLLVCLSGQW